jgi:hypothetical protein
MQLRVRLGMSGWMEILAQTNLDVGVRLFLLGVQVNVSAFVLQKVLDIAPCPRLVSLSNILQCAFDYRQHTRFSLVSNQYRHQQQQQQQHHTRKSPPSLRIFFDSNFGSELQILSHQQEVQAREDETSVADRSIGRSVSQSVSQSIDSKYQTLDVVE